MAKYKVPKQIFKLIFAEHDGLEVRITAPTIGELSTIMHLTRFDASRQSTLTDSDIRELEGPQRIFAKHLVSWNLTDDDEFGDEFDVPATLAGVNTLPPVFFQSLVKDWVEHTVEVPKDSPLSQPLSVGRQYQGPPIPMEIPSLNLHS